MGGPTCTIGSGQRSDLGIGKSFLGPGVGEYDVRGKLDGPKIRFGNEWKTTAQSIEKTWEPGPGSYKIPGTVGNIPKYLLMSKRNKKVVKEEEDED